MNACFVVITEYLFHFDHCMLVPCKFLKIYKCTKKKRFMLIQIP